MNYLHNVKDDYMIYRDWDWVILNPFSPTQHINNIKSGNQISI